MYLSLFMGIHEIVSCSYYSIYISKDQILGQYEHQAPVGTSQHEPGVPKLGSLGITDIACTAA